MNIEVLQIAIKDSVISVKFAPVKVQCKAMLLTYDV